MPIAYLYRHSLELALKHLARLGQVAGVVASSKNLDEDLGGHDLARIWGHVRAGIEASYPSEDRKVLRNVEALINDFQRVDRSGQNLRYTQDKQRQPTARKYPPALDLAAFRDAFAGIHNLLEACADDFAHRIGIRAEMEGWE